MEQIIYCAKEVLPPFVCLFDSSKYLVSFQGSIFQFVYFSVVYQDISN